jgi:hypothetical protein
VKVSDYIIRPSDALFVTKKIVQFIARYIDGLIVSIAIYGVSKTLLGLDVPASLFLAGIYISLRWKLRSSLLLVVGIICLSLIPVINFLVAQSVLWVGDTWEDPLAASAYYLLVLAVLGQAMQLWRKKDLLLQRDVKGSPNHPPVKRVRMRDMETIAKLRANREALRSRDR